MPRRSASAGSRRSASSSSTPGASSAAPAAAVDTADRLHSAAIHLLRRLRRQDDAAGLGGPRLSALSVIVHAGPITIGDLATAEQVRPPTITRLVAALEAEGLVRREIDPDDRRIVRLHPTAQGRRVLREGRHRRVAELAQALADLPARDVAVLERAVGILERIVGSRGQLE
jgi:DNA-binding MarR family transcriptional regulator